jgi:tRNA(Glu) U13 pseudouridine synthase TruD
MIVSMNPLDLKLPYISKAIEGIGGRIKKNPEDFIVEEIPAYQPEGEGEHLLLHMTKKGITTRTVQKNLARLFQIKDQDINFTGLKDKQAITSQYFSIWMKKSQDPNLVYQLEDILPVKINKLTFHQRKIKNKGISRFLLSAFQSYLFNYYMVNRIHEGLYDKVLVGDIAKKYDTGGIFVIDHAESEQKRFDQKAICYTGPIFGRKMKPAEDLAAKLEEKTLQDNHLSTITFQSTKLTGTRRTGIIMPSIKAEQEDNGVRLQFTLPKGAFASIVLTCIIHKKW